MASPLNNIDCLHVYNKCLSEVITVQIAHPHPICHVLLYWAIQQSWFARVNALCNLSQKKSQEVAAHFRADF